MPDISVPALVLAVETVDNVDLTDPAALFQPCIQVRVIPNPELVQAFNRAGVTNAGEFTWVAGLGEESSDAWARVLGDYVRPGQVIFNNVIGSGSEIANVRGMPGRERFSRRGGNPITTPRYQRIAPYRENQLGSGVFYAYNQPYESPTTVRTFPAEGPDRFAAVVLDIKRNTVYIKLHSYFLPDDNVPQEVLSVLDVRRPGRSAYKAPSLLRPDAALRVLDWAHGNGFKITGPTRALSRLRDRIAKSVILTPAPGRPAEAIAIVGCNVDAATRDALGVSLPFTGSSSGVVTLDDAQMVDTRLRLPADSLVCDPQVDDMITLMSAPPLDDTRLRPYQARMAGLHVATRYGLVDALPTGLGKTIATLAALQHRSHSIPRYRALVGVEAIVRDQWRGETEEWFPEAEVFTLTSASQTSELEQALNTTDGPLVVIASYTMLTHADEVETPRPLDVYVADPVIEEDGQLSLFANGLTPVEVVASPDAYADDQDPLTLGELLVGTRWHDLVADEATVLATTSTVTAKAMWRLRENSDVAVALTATPADKDFDELGRMIAWARGSRYMFHGNRLDALFDDYEPLVAAEKFRSAVGPLVFRVDKNPEDVPELNATPVLLTPTPAEYALADAARNELKKVYQELVRCVALLDTDRDGLTTEELEELRADLQAARGAWLGGTTLALMACADPATLLESDSSGAMLLASQGLIDPAVATGGTKRRWLLETLRERCANGDKVIVFTQFRRVADNLLADLTEAGLVAGSIVGGGGRRRDLTVAAFQRGELDVVVATKAAEKGLNLQRANVIVHYDLPWTPRVFMQRNGRMERIGSEHDKVETLIPLMDRTIEIRVANVVTARAMKAMLALDGSRELSKTTIGKSFAGLADLALADGVGEVEAGLLAIGAYLLGEDARQPALV